MDNMEKRVGYLMATYIINVEKKEYARRWTPDIKHWNYVHYFEIKTLHLSKMEVHHLAEEQRHRYPSPDYRVSVFKVETKREEVNI